jgi:flagellar motility protein MotE (MotC chaperone)
MMNGIRRSLLGILAAGAFYFSMVLTLEGNEETHTEQKPTAQASASPTPVAEVEKENPKSTACLTSEVAFEDMKKNRAEIEAQKKEIAKKEADLKSREKILNEELKRLEELRDIVSKVQQVKKKEDSEKVAKLVETILTMSPKAAAKMIANLDDQLAVESMLQMDTVKLAKIMNLLDPKKSSQLSELMAGNSRSNLKEKGGEIKYANANTNANDRSHGDEPRQPTGSQQALPGEKAEKGK